MVSESVDIDSSPWLALLAEASDGVVVVAPRPWPLVYANSTFASWLGREAAELRGQLIEDVLSRDAAHELAAELADVLDEKVRGATVSLVQGMAARLPIPMEIRLQRVEVDGRPLVAMLVRRDDAGSWEATAEQHGRRDPVTGLPDRTVLMTRMAALVGGGRSADQRFAVLFIDLDDFKQVNDAHGHLVGDDVLGEVGRRLASCVRAGDTIARFGGDEFVALVEHISGWSEIAPVVERIHAALAEPVALADVEVTLSVSVGVAEASAEHRTPEDLLRDADQAMYASKRAGI